MAKETKHLEQIQEQVHDADIELLASQIAYKELERRQTKELNEKTDAIVKKNEREMLPKVSISFSSMLTFK